MNIIYLIVGFFFFILIGVAIAFGSSIINLVFDEVVPEVSNLGMVGPANLTEIAGYTIAPINTVVQNFTWLAGVVYTIGLLALFGLAFAFRINGNKWLISLFFVCMFLLIITCIFLSNIYEDFYNDPGDIGPRLQEHTILSFLILYSPMIMCVVGFICGIIIFTGGYTNEESL